MPNCATVSRRVVVKCLAETAKRPTGLLQQPLLAAPVDAGRKTSRLQFSQSLQVPKVAERALRGLRRLALPGLASAFRHAESEKRLAHVAIAFGGEAKTVTPSSAIHATCAVPGETPLPPLQAGRRIVRE